MIERADRVVAIVDQSKFGNVEMFGFAAFEDPDVVITDTRVDPGAVEALEEHGLVVHRV